MKQFGAILAIYILSLSLFPCCQADNCSEIETEQTADHGKEDEDCGNCSPFFSCAGCVTASILPGTDLMEFVPVLVMRSYSTHYPDALSRNGRKCWQPPKLV